MIDLDDQEIVDLIREISFSSSPRLAEIMRVSVRTVDRMVREGCPHETWGRRAVRFLPSVALEWARCQERSTRCSSN